MDSFIYNLNQFFYFILTFLTFILFLFFIPDSFFKNKGESDIALNKLKFYGLFMGLSKYDIFLFSIRTTSYLFLVWCLFSNDLQKIHFTFLILSGIVFELLSKRFFKIPFSLINYIFLSFLLISKQIFYQYLEDVVFIWPVVLLVMLLCIFIFLFGTYCYLKDVGLLSKRNKYVSRLKEKSFLKKISDRLAEK